ncbi:MAG TPA: hypothetical protein VFV38_00080, partial [Ktedonobacteraceae bacterium]|nr:hypothetical protein [Ktedonobacteraceae bacterium]
MKAPEKAHQHCVKCMTSCSWLPACAPVPLFFILSLREKDLYDYLSPYPARAAGRLLEVMLLAARTR